jgi:hypothetical protein
MSVDFQHLLTLRDQRRAACPIAATHGEAWKKTDESAVRRAQAHSSQLARLG